MVRLFSIIFLLIFVTFCFFTQSVVAQGMSNLSIKRAKALGMDLNDRFVRENFANLDKKVKLRNKIKLRKIKYIVGSSRERILTKKDFDKYRNKNLPSQQEIETWAKDYARQNAEDRSNH